MIRYAVGAIIFHQAEILLVHKVKVSAIEDKHIQGEWDFPKGGVEQSDKDLEAALLRELAEETGSIQYKVIEQLEEKIAFHFSRDFTNKTGFTKQETTMFIVEYLGDRANLSPQDNEISDIEFLCLDKTLERLTHQDTKLFFEKVFEKISRMVLC
ncbi:NUDIX domain-containing protein [Bacillus ndiopicus]|uniref:NUDIX domain-containing protein n=1 Tax=Bacillus ndiopicus TaxID=1347368 RepID=UPI0005AAE3A3|nr:NUDIX hydrolase [Bacillus ndiopicus]